MDKFLETCNTIKEFLPHSFNWEFDGRFSVSLFILEKDYTELILDKITQLFDSKYDSSSIKKASKEENKLAEELSGIGDDQLLFVSTNDDLYLFGAWWPWGNGSKVSLRIGLFSKKEGIVESEEIMNSLKS